jgi:sulfite reductase beta subunit-like hemoprotein
VPEGFGGYQSEPQPLGDGALLPVLDAGRTGEPEYDAWVATNVEHQKQTGYAAVTVRVDQGNLTGVQLRGLARISSTAGDGLVRVAIGQNLLLAFIPLGRLPRVYAALRDLAWRSPARGGSKTWSPARARTPATWG